LIIARLKKPMRWSGGGLDDFGPDASAEVAASGGSGDADGFESLMVALDSYFLNPWALSQSERVMLSIFDAGPPWGTAFFASTT
jgi:hypothetical protein